MSGEHAEALTLVTCGAPLTVRLPLTLVAMVSDRLWGHPARAGHLPTPAAAGARFVDPATTTLAPPAPVPSGFDPAAPAAIVGPPRLR